MTVMWTPPPWRFAAALCASRASKTFSTDARLPMVDVEGHLWSACD